MGVEFCQRTNIPTWHAFAQFWLGELSFDIGDYEKSSHYLTKSILILEKNKLFPSWVILSKLALARSKVMNNEKDINLNEIRKYYNENKTKVFEGFIPMYIGEILLIIDNNHMSEAEDWINKAIEADRQNSTMYFLGRAYAVYADFCKRKDDMEKARDNLDKAIEIFQECGADGWVEKYEKELDAIS
jgi:tetratricopeptide (TPR) repeat protein